MHAVALSKAQWFYPKGISRRKDGQKLWDDNEGREF
jgi:hypothetical protein